MRASWAFISDWTTQIAVEVGVETGRFAISVNFVWFVASLSDIIILSAHTGEAFSTNQVWNILSAIIYVVKQV